MVLIGSAVTLAPFALTRWSDDPAYGAWQIVLLTTLTNVGTALLLAVVIFVLQRHFTQDVRETVVEAAKDEVNTQTRELREETAQLRTRIDDLTRQFGHQVEERDQEALDVVTRARDHLAFDTVAELFEVAADMRALWFGSVMIPAGAELEGPRVRIRWADLSSVWRSGNAFDNYRDTASPAIQIELERPTGTGGSWSPAEALWLPWEQPADAWSALAEAMVVAGHGALVRELDPTVAMNHLVDALEAAISGRRHTPHSWMSGALDEWVTDGWAVTEYGLESRDHGSIASRSFPEHNATALRRMAGGAEEKDFNPERPTGVDADVWRCALAAARSRHYRAVPVAAMATDHGPITFTSQTSPRNQPNWPPTDPST
ncbi:hypothetical protein [Nocardioides sp. Leaf285]|uniref:hypothetical protein n=1 Tax=Nocardioides sp. Leaf285 TaxID=1736322 RepID=UPI0007034C3D|nr:hypothetical protein [Nocardioides sp. Leaf285]KQP63516.1 hypothetical protein ASF47_15770 [Nocardioides sp. Leaf285]